MSTGAAEGATGGQLEGYAPLSLAGGLGLRRACVLPLGCPAGWVAQWYVIDAEGQTLGRLASLAADYIRGKQNATYTPRWGWEQ